METRKTVLALAVLALVAVGLVAYFLTRGASRTGPEPGLAQPASDFLETRTGEAKASSPDAHEVKTPHQRVKTASQLQSVEEINELILQGSPEFDELDEETRNYMIRQLLRDALERTVSLASIRREFEFASALAREERSAEALTIFLALYDVTSSPDNICRALRDGRFASSPEHWKEGLADFMAGSAEQILRIYTKSGEAEHAREWARNAVADMEALALGVASGMDRAKLTIMEPYLFLAAEGRNSESEAIAAGERKEIVLEAATALEAYLTQENLTSEDRFGSLAFVADLYVELGRYEEALARYSELHDHAEACGYNTVWAADQMRRIEQRLGAERSTTAR